MGDSVDIVLCQSLGKPLPWTGLLKQQNISFSQLYGLESKIKELVDLVSDIGTLSGLQGPSPCTLMWSKERALIIYFLPRTLIPSWDSYSDDVI